MSTQHSDYYRSSLCNPTQLPRLIAQSVADLIQVRDAFDAIAVRGVSGLIVGPAVAAALHKQLIVVRKSLDDSHADVLTEGEPYDDYRYIVLDDFICSGDSIRAVKRALRGLHVKTYLYDLRGTDIADRLTEKLVDKKPEPVKEEALAWVVKDIPSFTLKDMAEKGKETSIERLARIYGSKSDVQDKVTSKMTNKTVEEIFGVLGAGVGYGTKD